MNSFSIGTNPESITYINNTANSATLQNVTNRRTHTYAATYLPDITWKAQ